MLTMRTTYVVLVKVPEGWVDDPAHRDRATIEAARRHYAVTVAVGHRRIVKRTVIEEDVPAVGVGR